MTEAQNPGNHMDRDELSELIDADGRLPDDTVADDMGYGSPLDPDRLEQIRAASKSSADQRRPAQARRGAAFGEPDEAVYSTPEEQAIARTTATSQEADAHMRPMSREAHAAAAQRARRALANAIAGQAEVQEVPVGGSTDDSDTWPGKPNPTTSADELVDDFDRNPNSWAVVRRKKHPITGQKTHQWEVIGQNPPGTLNPRKPGPETRYIDKDE